jgi:hypothetical protein
MLAKQETGKIIQMKMKSFFFFTIQHFSACILNVTMGEQVLKQLTEMHELEI